MSGLYVDTSALGRVLLDEPDASRIVEVVARYDVRWSSALLLVELRRLAAKVDLLPAAEAALATVRLFDLDVGALERASRIEPVEVRSLDVIHLGAAVPLAGRADIAAVLTFVRCVPRRPQPGEFDTQLQVGCAHHGLRVEAPLPA